MRQLLLVLFIFILSLLGLVALFNTVTNTSKQSNIVLATNLPDYPKAEQHLTEALQWQSSADSMGKAQLVEFYAWIRQAYPLLFNNPNIEWQEFGPSNWVAKWIGRKEDLAPIVWMASPEVTVPTKTQQAAWSVPPFSGSLTSTHIYGKGSQGGKAAMIAMLEVLHHLVAHDRLPDRTLYLAFPFPAQVGEAEVLKTLNYSGTTPEYILQTGGGIAEGLLWELPTPVALLGVGQLAKAQITLVRKKPTINWITFLQRLEQQMPAADLEQEVAQQLLAQLSPELPFQQRFIFSNSWLLNWTKATYFPPSSLPLELVGTTPQLIPTLPDSDTALLQITAPHLEESVLINIKELLKKDSVYVVGNWTEQQGQKTAAIDSRSYRLLGNTCKEVFPNLITAPVWVKRNPKVKQSMDRFFFQPTFQDPDSWEKAKLDVNERISRKNYKQLLQFYHQLLSNSI
ncbi:MAG: hypothetical protein ACRBFS_16895 [Aureispira sp.]